MAGKSETLELIIRARDAASSTINSALGAIKTNVKSLMSSVFNLKTAFATLITALGIRSLVSAANEQAKAVAGLETALRSMGRYTPELSKKLQDLASSFQDTTNFEDEAIIQGQKLLVIYKKITDDMLPETTRTMLDLAAILGGDTTQAATMLGKASEGMTEMLSKVGIVVDDQVYKLKGFKGVLEAVQRQVSGQAAALREAAGPWEALGNIFGDVKEEAGFMIREVADMLGEDLIEALKLARDQIQEFRKSAGFKEWAKETSDSIKNAFLTAIKFTGILIEGLTLAERSFYGIKFVINAVLAGVTTYYGALLKIYSTYMSIFPWMRGLSGKLTTVSDELKAVSAVAREEMAKDGVKLEELADEQGEGYAAMLTFAEELQKRFDQLDKKKKVSPQTAAATPGAPAEDTKLREAEDKAYIDRLKETTETALLTLENLYKDGKIKLDEYFAERRDAIINQYDSEIVMTEDAIKKEGDAVTKIELNTKLIALREKLNRALIELDMEKQDKMKELDDQELDRKNILEDMKLRISQGAAGTLQAQFAAELAEMDNRHQEEIEKLRELNAAKEELDEAYRAQKMEKDQLMFDQERRLQEARLSMAADVAGGLEDIFNGLYELTGQKHKAFFYLAKAAAIAESIVNTEQAATKALAQGGIWGIVSAAVVRAAGMVSIANIAAQSLAAGGLVAGVSPSAKADDKIIAATAGEFMQPVDVVRHYGLSVMEAIRKKAIPRGLLAGFSIPQAAVAYPRTSFAMGGAVTKESGIGGSSRQILIANLYDKDEMGRFLASYAGQDIVVNIISAKRNSIKKILT
jgi:hypothetical protein